MIKTCETCGGQMTTDAVTFRPCVCYQFEGICAENKRYREALEKIALLDDDTFPGTAISVLQRIAREALDTDDASRKAVEQYFRERGHDV